MLGVSDAGQLELVAGRKSGRASGAEAGDGGLAGEKEKGQQVFLDKGDDVLVPRAQPDAVKPDGDAVGGSSHEAFNHKAGLTPSPATNTLRRLTACLYL